MFTFNQFTFSPLFGEYRMVDPSWDGRASFEVSNWPAVGRIEAMRSGGATPVVTRTFSQVSAGNGIFEYASDDQRVTVSNDPENFYSF